MLFHRLVKTDELQVDGHAYSVRYFENETARGTLRYSSELLLGPADRIILDGNSVTALESKVARLVPATIYSRLLASRAA
jgi:hypothetical protein